MFLFFFDLDCSVFYCFFFFQAEDGIRDGHVTGVQTCALPICQRLTSRPELVNSTRRRCVRGSAPDDMAPRVHIPLLGGCTSGRSRKDSTHLRRCGSWRRTRSQTCSARFPTSRCRASSTRCTRPVMATTSIHTT